MGGDRVTVLIRYRAQGGQAERARRELDALIRLVVAQEPECGGIWIYQDTAVPEQLLLIERWTSEAAFTGPHMQTAHLEEFRNRSREYLAGPPETSFWREVGGAER